MLADNGGLSLGGGDGSMGHRLGKKQRIAMLEQRIAKLEQWRDDHEARHTRDHDALLLAMRNEIALSTASVRPIDAVLKWVAGLLALLIAGILAYFHK